MKNILTLIFGFTCLLTSCTIMDYQVTTYTADLRPFSKDGFFISPALSIAETYEPVSLLEISFRAGYRNGEYFVPSYDEMLDKLAAEAKAHGANAILNCNIKADISYSKYGTSLNGYTASGYAVRIAGRSVASAELVTDSKYDLQKAVRLNIDSGIPLIAKKGNRTEYLDPQTESYLDETSFTNKYGRAILFQLEEFSAKRFVSDESSSKVPPLYIMKTVSGLYPDVKSNKTERLFLDNETGKYISKRKFLRKYGEAAFDELVQKIENESTIRTTTKTKLR